MSEKVMPDSLVNSLIKHRQDGTVKRVIRDDGRNGLQVSPPENPTAMRPISVEDFDADWELYMTVDDQLKDSAPEVEDRDRPFRGQHEGNTVRTGADLSSQVQLPSVDSRNGVDSMDTAQRHGALNRDPFAGRTTPTPRNLEDAEEFTKRELADETFTGEPVGGNEEPAEAFEEDRADDEGMALAEEPADNSPEAEEKPKKGSKKSSK